jgi:uncharacterized glyoxalase superfamily protein PhnB
VTAQLTAYLAVRDARAAMEFYCEALGARMVGEPIVMDDDRIGHAELDIAGARLFVSDAYPEIGVVAADPDAHSVSLVLTVPDVDAAVQRVDELGGTVERQPKDEPYGRTGVVIDPYGHRWFLQHPAPDENGSNSPRPGDTVYLTLQVPDGARARDFYEAVLGWSISHGRVADGWQTEGATPMVGIAGGTYDHLGAVPMYAVDDIEVAVAAVKTAGGLAGEIEDQTYGRSVLCRDDQGLPFFLGQLN